MDKKTNNNKTNRNIIIKIILIILVLFMLIGVTYAWFEYIIIGNEEAKTISLKGGDLEITYTDGPQLNAENIIPGWSLNKTFTVTNTGDTPATYKIAWKNIRNNFINRADLIYSITSTNGGGSLSQTQIPDTENHILIANNINIAAGVTQTYTITFQYLLTQYNQSSDKERTLSGTIEVLGLSETTIEPLISTGSVLADMGEESIYQRTMSDVFNALYPVGSIYMSSSSISPTEIMGGQWTRIKDTFLLAAGDTYAADNGTNTTAIAGSANEVIVSHSHTFNMSHRHGMGNVFSNGAGNDGSGYVYAGNGIHMVRTTGSGGSTATPTTHTIDASSNNEVDNETGAGKNMPPYLPVYVWKRTA